MSVSVVNVCGWVCVCMHAVFDGKHLLLLQRPSYLGFTHAYSLSLAPFTTRLALAFRNGPLAEIPHSSASSAEARSAAARGEASNVRRDPDLEDGKRRRVEAANQQRR